MYFNPVASLTIRRQLTKLVRWWLNCRKIPFVVKSIPRGYPGGVLRRPCRKKSCHHTIIILAKRRLQGTPWCACGPCSKVGVLQGAIIVIAYVYCTAQCRNMRVRRRLTRAGGLLVALQVPNYRCGPSAVAAGSWCKDLGVSAVMIHRGKPCHPLRRHGETRVRVLYPFSRRNGFSCRKRPAVATPSLFRRYPVAHGII